MTWSRYNAIHAYREYHPTVKHLLTILAAQQGYKPPSPPKSGEEAVRELMGMFPTGEIRMGGG